MTQIRSILRMALAAGLFCAPASAARQAATATRPESRDQEARREVRHGLDLLMDGDPDAAVAVFRQIQIREPQSPLGYLFEADAAWWKIYYTTANLLDPEVLDVAVSDTTPYDAHFEDLVNTAIHKASARPGGPEDEARNDLYQALGYALRARLAGLRGRDLPTARAGKKMRALSVAALRLDPKLTDAYMGVGIYNYFVDTLPTIVKLLRFLIALPGGSRELGLEQLRWAAEKGDVTRADAKFQLAKDYSRASEKQYAKSLKLFQEFEREYPHNPLWPLLAADLECRLDRVQPCEASYREVLRQTAGEQAEAKRVVHAAALRALERLHPEEKIE